MAQKIRFKNFLFLSIILMLQTKLYGQYLPSDWESTTMLGRGNAVTAWANDGAGLFYNPAGLSLLRNRHSNQKLNDSRSPLPDEIQANNQMLSQTPNNPSNWPQKMLDGAKQNLNQPSYFNIQAFPYVVFGGKNTPAILIGIPVRSENSAIFVDTSNPQNASINSINTVSAAIGIANASLSGGFRWGLSVRPNYRIQYKTETYNDIGNLSASDYVKNINNLGVKSSAIALDAGVMFTLSDYWFPTFALSVLNIPTGCNNNYVDPITYKVEKMCGTPRAGASNSTWNESQIDPTEVRAGVAVTPRGRIGKMMIDLRLSADIYPIPISTNGSYYGISSLDSANLVHAGAELFFGNALNKSSFALRGGYMNQAETWGGSVNIYFFDLGYSSYVVNSAVQDATNTITKYTERRQSLYLDWSF